MPAGGTVGQLLTKTGSVDYASSWQTPAAGLVKLFDSKLVADAASLDTGVGAIPAGYAALEVLMYIRTSDAVGAANLKIVVNNDTANNYEWQRLTGNGTAAVAFAAITQPNWHAWAAGANASANVFGVTRMMIPNYDTTAGYKAANWTGGLAEGTTTNAYTGTWNGHWRNAGTALSRLTVSAFSGGNIKAGSRLVVFGIG